MPNEAILYGKSGNSYRFTIHPLAEDLPSNFAGLYVYLNSNPNGYKLIYVGKSVDIPQRHRQHKQKSTAIDKAIMSKSTHIGVCYHMYVDELIDKEIDLLEGNEFELNTQHNP